MDYAKVCKIFANMAGLSTESAVAEIALIRLAEQLVVSRLKDRSQANQNAERILYIIAADAFYRYAVLHAFEQPGGTIQLGTVKIQQDAKSAVERAKEIRDACMADAADLLIDPHEFYFKKVHDDVSE